MAQNSINALNRGQNMNKKNTKKLYNDFPNLYKQHKLSIMESCMPWGFDCGDGWFNLIYDLSKKISDIAPECEVVQVKEKFATLRFYVNGYNDEIDKLINEAEELSGRTCEICGDTETAKIRGDGWLSTLCDKCAMIK